MNARLPDIRKRKANAALVQIADQEAKYFAAIANNETNPHVTMLPVYPHLVDVGVMQSGCVLWYTLEPFTHEYNENGIQGWDGKRRRTWLFTWDKIWDTKINSGVYKPIEINAWKARFRETNMKHVEENTITQHTIRYW